MKNIHLIPTDRPSRLHFDGKLFLSPNYQDSKTINSTVEGRNIYITSDEEIKEGEWVVKISSLYKGGGNVQKYSFIDSQFEDITFKKIILTTDQDLIADGVQPISDEFLEWFVKNPSCEFVEVEKRYSDFTVEPFIGYKIIIPQEEPKCSCKVGEPYNNACCKVHGGIPREEPKQDSTLENAKLALREYLLTNKEKVTKDLQEMREKSGTSKDETLEEVAENRYVQGVYVINGIDICEASRECFIEGAKWQQERMYSEEEIMDMFHSFNMHLPLHYEFLVKEQFKKK